MVKYRKFKVLTQNTALRFLYGCVRDRTFMAVSVMCGNLCIGNFLDKEKWFVISN